MSSSGDIGGEVSGDEAAWRDLIARFDSPAYPDSDVAPWPSREDLPAAATGTSDAGSTHDQPTGPATGGQAAGGQAAGGQAGDSPPTGSLSSAEYIAPDRTRVIRHAGDPRSYSPPEEEDEQYVPEPLPPPAKLDPLAKAAWAGLVGGPAYLLIATFLSWTISAVAAFAAVAAFVGGFVTLVIRLGDRPRRDDDDNGAVL